MSVDPLDVAARMVGSMRDAANERLEYARGAVEDAERQIKRRRAELQRARDEVDAMDAVAALLPERTVVDA